MSLWTETPQERQQRLEDEVMGRKRRAVEVAAGAADDDPDKKRRKREEAAIKRSVDEYNVRTFHNVLVRMGPVLTLAAEKAERTFLDRPAYRGGGIKEEG